MSLFIQGLFGSGVLEGRGGDILNFYVWLDFLTRGGKGRISLFFFTLNLISSKYGLKYNGYITSKKKNLKKSNE
jgi:hypothetical protein